jgi:hypothetical protein
MLGLIAFMALASFVVGRLLALSKARVRARAVIPPAVERRQAAADRRSQVWQRGCCDHAAHGP